MRRVNSGTENEKNLNLLRWLSVPLCLFLEGLSGTSYCFGAYSSQLKSVLNLGQGDLNTISSIGNFGGYLAFPGGLLYDKYGPRLTLIVGGVICSVGYALTWMLTLGILPKSFELVCVLYFIAWHGCSYIDATAVATTIKNFPQNRGFVLGLVKSFFGLSGSIFAQIYVAFFLPKSTHKHSGTFGPLLVVVFGVANCVGRMIAGFFSDKFQSKINRPIFYAIEFMLMAIGQLLYVFAPNNSQGLCPKPAPADGSTMPFLLFIGITVFLGAMLLSSFVRAIPPTTEMSPQETPWVSFGYVNVLILSVFLAIIGFIQNQWKVEGTFNEHHNVTVYFTVVMLVLMLSLSIVAIAGFRGNYVVHSEEETLSLFDSSEKEFQSMANLTIFQCLKSLDFWLVFWPQLFGTGCGLMVINNLGQIALAYGKSIQVLAATILVGVSYGGYWALNPTLIMELFGRDHFGSNYTFGNLAPACGSYIVSVGIAATIYNQHKGTKSCCLGTSCYKTTFFIGTALCFLASFLICVLTYRTRKFYTTIRKSESI